jgi:outer membrane receptor protein involved in Fe transport
MKWSESMKLIGLIVALLVPSTVLAQGTTGSLSGYVVDAAKAAVAGATVTATNVETGVVRKTMTDHRGMFRVLDLPPGTFSVRSEMSSFSPSSRDRVLVTLGHDTPVDLMMVPAVAVQVAVEGVAGLLDARTAAAGGVVSRVQIAELPLNGRNFLQLATLQPGVVLSRATGRDFTTGFANTQLSIAGSRPEHSTFLLDGTNISDISDKSPSSVAGGLLGVDAVREFNVLTHGYSAEFGRAAGGVMSIVTRSGTNQWRGGAFEFHRDSALDSRNYFDVGDPPGFRRDQFGASIGGPVRKQSVFVFAAGEGLSEQRSVTRVARLPDQAAHNGMLPAAGGGLRAVNVHANVRPYLDLLFPIPTGQSFGDGTAELRHGHRDPTDERFGIVKLDWQARPADSVMVRYSHDTADATTSLDHPLFRSETRSRSRYLTAQHQHVFSPAVLNTLRLALNRTSRQDDVLPNVDIPSSLLFTADPHFGAITIVGVTMAGSTGAIPANYNQRVFQLLDTFTWNKNDHVFKAGVDWQHYRFGGVSYSRYGGEFRFRNLEEFLILRRSSSAQADRFTGNLPGTDTQREMRQDYLAAFVQDDWHAGPRLTLNLGVRYDFASVPTESEGRVAGLVSLDDLESGPHGVTAGSPFYDNPSGRNFAPRLGAVWAPTENATIRGGYGLFYQPLTVSYYRATTFRVFPYFAGVDLRQPAVFGPGIQAVLAQPDAGSSVQRRSEFIAYDAKQPFVEQWHVTAQRTLGAGFTGELGYLGSKGHNLPFYGDPNSIPAQRLADGRKRVVPGASLRYPSWGRIRTRINVARSESHYLVAGLRRQFSDGLEFQAAYTFGKSSDTWSGGLQGSADFDNGAGSATDWWDPEDEYGPSNFDVRHTLVVNAVWKLPWGGWNVAGVLNMASGLPFTPFIGFDRAGDGQSDADLLQKPDQIGPVSYGKTPDAWFDASAFALPASGYYGNTRRNSLRGPGLKVVDLAVFKDLSISRTTVQLRVEAFNLFNWVNFGIPDATALFNTDGTRRSGVGRITSTATPARQVQLGVKISF